MLSKDLTAAEQRLVKTIRFTQLAMVLTVLSYLFEAVMSSTVILRPSTITVASAVVLSEIAVRFVYAKRKTFAFSIFLVIITVTLFVSIWCRGGLYSTGIIGVPIVILFSVLYGQLRDVLWLLASVFLYTAVLAKPSLFGWPPDVGAVSDSVYQLPVVVVLISVGGYLSWAIGNDMRIAFRSLHAETVSLSESQDSIFRLSKTDFLTGLLNVKQACADYKALLVSLTKEQHIAFYYIDLNGFKEVNDLFDHKAGDELLVLVANRLSKLVDETAYVCRLSGDEFVIFFAVNQDSDVTAFAKKLSSTIAEPHNLFGTSAQITASIGIATTNEHSFTTIRKKANMAMYQSKRDVTSHYYLYSDALEEQYMRRIYVLQGLENCVENGLLELHFQPKVDLDTRQIIGMEALIRWTKDNPKSYTPDKFMSVVESTDLVHEIGFWVITEACIACKSWHKVGHEVPVAVNVSAQQLFSPDFAETVLQILSTQELDSRFLEIELTERFFIDQNEAVEKQLVILRQAGVSLAIDDFGTGYSNVSYLMTLDANVLKLDKQFVDRLQTHSSMKPVIKAIIEIARAVQMKVVVEGLETLADVNAVTELGCDIGQGYYWSEPLSQQETIKLLDGEMCA
jgi:diguanylate cyclase (GGDEF)-like protein